MCPFRKDTSYDCVIAARIYWGLSARLQYLQCVSNGDSPFLHKAIHMYCSFLVQWMHFTVMRILKKLIPSTDLHCMSSCGNQTVCDSQICNYIYYNAWHKITYPFPSKVQLLKFWNRQVISSHALQGIWCLIHPGIRGLKIIHVNKRGPSSCMVSKIICCEVLFPFASHQIRHREIQMEIAITAKLVINCYNEPVHRQCITWSIVNRSV